MWISLACVRAPQPEVPEDLAEASEQVIFESVEDIGSHVYNATVVREEFHQDDKLSSHVETVEIIWSDWDNFSYRRIVDKTETLNVRVVSGTPFKKSRAGLWAKKRDAEPYRIQMSHAWNVWEQNTKPFQAAMIKRPTELEAIESRDTQIYILELGPLADSDGSKFRPKSLDGKVWVDKKTAVRLKAEVKGSLSTSHGTKTMELNLERSKIGHALTLNPPTILPKEKE